MPRILRSPGSRSFRLENVSVPIADGARCERRRHPRRPKAKSVSGQTQKSERATGQSALPSRTDVASLAYLVRNVPIPEVTELTYNGCRA
jgi:hypothetical protein